MIQMKELDFIYNRKSIRRFKDEKVQHDHLLEIIKAGMHAPSGKNLQNWHFVVIEDKEVIIKTAKIIKEKYDSLLSQLDDKEKTESLKKKIRYYTFFENAPALILVYASKYETGTLDLLTGKDLEKFKFANPGIQNIGSAMENILLASSALGYGSCWMTGPNFAINEIEEYINLDQPGYSLVAMTPVGVPSDDKHMSPKRKSIKEKVTFIK